jgi:TolB-like protein/DNA-binding winged helix-turn-helix (wHTH) protein
VKTVLGVRREANPIVSEPAAFRLGDVEVLPASGRVRGPRGDEKLDPKVMDVLLCLVSAEGKVLSKDAVMSEVWGDIIVTDFALSRCIYQLRKTLGQVSRRTDSPIRTLPKRGYCLDWSIEPSEPRAGVDKSGSWSLRFAALAVILAVTGFLAWHQWTRATGIPDSPSIAVLPFVELTPAGDQTYLGAGIAQSLLTELGHIRELDVIAHNSSFSLKDADMNLKGIAAALGASYLVEGNVWHESDTVHVTASLVDGRSGYQVWSRTFESDAMQSFSMQREIAAEIAGYLEVSLGNPGAHGGTSSYPAFEAYLRALEEPDEAVASLFIDEALAHDSHYARALVAKAHFIYLRMWQGIGSAEEAWRKAEPVLDQALSITDELPYAHVLIAGFQMRRERFDQAEAELERALEINPSHNEAYAHLSRLMEQTGRGREAVILAERNVHLDPLNPIRHVQLANRLWAVGDIATARSSFEQAFELDPLDHSIWIDYAYRLGDLESPVSGFRLVGKLQQNPEFRSQFLGPVPKIPPSGVQLFGLWFGFIQDFEHEREMLLLQSRMADNARLHRELAWALIGEGDLDGARKEAWTGLGGMPRAFIANFQVAYIALQTGEGMSDVLDHYRAQWPEFFDSTPEPGLLPSALVAGVALIYRQQGDEERAIQLLQSIDGEGEDTFAARAMALAHLGEIDQAMETLDSHIDSGGYFSYLPGDPFWAPLANDARFIALCDDERRQALEFQHQVNAMIESGGLVLPGQLDYHASLDR